MKKIIVMLVLMSGILNAGIKWDQVIGGALFATASYYFMQDGFSQVESTFPSTMIIGFTANSKDVSGTFYNTGNTTLFNYKLQGYALTWKKYISPTGVITDVEDQRIPFSYSYAQFGSGMSIPLIFNNLTSSTTIQLVHEESWDYVKAYKMKSELQGYIAAAFLTASIYAIVDGLGIFDGAKMKGVTASIDIPGPGTTGLNIKYCF